MKQALLIWCFALSAMAVSAQNNRHNIYGNIGWFSATGTLKFSNKVSAHTELHIRRYDFIPEAQQDMIRVGANYQVKPNILLRTGYAFAETYNYGDIPINGLGRDFSEHRIFEMVQLTHKEGRFDLIHRYMLEQRFVGRYSSADVSKEDEFPMVNRIRYMLRIQVPLKGNAIVDKTPYAAVYDEVMIAFGKNVNANVFDQNRIGLLLGYRFNKTIRVETGFINQIAQFGRLVNGKNVFQHNSGFMVNAIFNFDVSKKAKLQ